MSNKSWQKIYILNTKYALTINVCIEGSYRHTGSIPADIIPVGNVVCWSLYYDVVYNLDGDLKIKVFFLYVINKEYCRYISYTKNLHLVWYLHLVCTEPTGTVCPRSSYPIYIVTYNMKWVLRLLGQTIFKIWKIIIYKSMANN